MIIPSRKNWSTSLKSVIPNKKAHDQSECRVVFNIMAIILQIHTVQ